MEQLSDRQVGDLIVDRCAEEDDPLVEQTRVNVERALAVHGLLDYHRRTRSLPAGRPGLAVVDGLVDLHFRVTAHAVADRPAEASAGAYSRLHT